MRAERVYDPVQRPGVMPVHVVSRRFCAVVISFGGAAATLAQAPQAPPRSPAPGVPQPAPASSEVDARYANARKLSRSDHPEQAVPEYAWLWENALKVDPSKAEMRTSVVASEMEWLVSRTPEAKPRFIALRDDTEKRLTTAPAFDPLLVDDYLILNRIVGEQDRTLAWFDGAKADPAHKGQLWRLSQRVEQLLEANGRWADLGTFIYVKPLDVARQTVDMNRVAVAAAAKADPGQRDMLNATQERSYNARMSRLYASLLATRRDADAEQVLAIVAPTDVTGRTVLACITKALDIGEARASMRKPLNDAWDKGAGIKGARERLNKALK